MPGGVELDRSGRVGICRIVSPETRNALSPGLIVAIAQGLETLSADAEIRALVLAGSDEVFATGADPATLGATSADPPQEAVAAWERIAAVEPPIVAAVSGWALGTGFELALACDMLVATKATRFGQPEVALGLIPGGGATQRLTRVIGKQRTMELVLTGRRMGGEQAFKFGLVNVLADKRRWLQAATDLAAETAERAPIAVRLAKRAVLAAEREGLDDGLATERRLLAEAMATEDRVEGVSAFLEGREPRFEGR
jgi:enoyl-CoA hydratase/carnithine racemase